MSRDDQIKFFSSEEFKQMSQPFQNYVRAVFGLIQISRQSEEELWNRLTPDEQREATTIAGRLVARVKEKNNFLHH
jgi:hypothetical protein